MNSTDIISEMAKAIQLALGPVFLLTGIAGMLNVMSGRLSRIIDRGRALTEKPDVISTYEPSELRNELLNLERRRHITSRAINMITIAALLVCLVIVTLFIEALFFVRFNWLIGVLFILATLGLVVGLGYFLREVHLAGNTVRIRGIH
jgi:predicted nucleic acid-binding Zn ribbon protein